MKKHLPVLDGLRGTAALSVVMFHFQELSVGPDHPDNFWMRHAYLAVDFFFCLSGYVIGYAYDDRRDRMGARDFIAARLIRLHPMVVFGLALGLLSYLLDPFNHSGTPKPWLEIQQAPAWKLIGNALGGIVMLPTWPLPNRFGAFFSLNAPSWSLMWEYVASLGFAFALWRAKKGVLIAVAAIAAVALGISSYQADTLALGFGWGQAIYGLIRVSFSFTVGLLLFRSGIRLKSRAGFVVLSALLVSIFVLPGYGNSESGEVPLNWLYDLAAVVVAFPAIVLLGAGASTTGLVGKLCDLFGRLSYPLYMTHYAFVMLFADYVWTRSLSDSAVVWTIWLSTVGVTAIAYSVLVLYDEPVRRALSRLNRSTTPAWSARAAR